MTSIETHLPTDVSASTPAIATWLTTADHKKVGRLFIGTGLFGLVAGLVLAILVTFERINADSYQILSVDSVPQVLAAVRLLLTFGAVVPLLLGLSVAVVPLQLGARSNAFPRLAAAGFWIWLTGLGLALAAIIGNGGPNGGNSNLVDLYLAGSIVLGLGVLMTATSIAVTVLTNRAPGMGILRAPLFTWSSLVGSLAVILTMPVLIGTTLYVYIDHRYARAGFGGNTGVNQWIGWALSQPFSLLLAIPALGIVFDVVSTIGRNRLPQRSVAFVAIGVVAVTALATVTQTTITLPWEGAKFLDNAGTKIADLLPFLLLNVVPVLGLLGILLGAAAHIVGLVEDAGVIGSIYEAGVYVPITFGAIAIAFGGICYWGPKLWGRSISDKAATPLALLALLAIGLDSVPYFIAGFADQPTGLVNGFAYSGPQDLWNALTCAGFVVMLLATIAFVGLAIKSFTSGAAAGNDPWDGTTLEWATSSPPPAENFAGVIVVNSATPLADIKSDSSTGKVA